MRMVRTIVNRLAYIASCIISEGIRNIFLFLLIVCASFAFAFFALAHSTCYETIDVLKAINLDNCVFCYPEDASITCDEEVLSSIEDYPQVKEVVFNSTEIYGGYFESGKPFYLYSYHFLDNQLPLELKEGRMPQEDYEVVISESLEKEYKVGQIINPSLFVGMLYEDDIPIEPDFQDVELTVVGICYKDSLVMYNGYNWSNESILLNFFDTVEQIEWSNFGEAYVA